jgi:hypothetical protein
MLSYQPHQGPSPRGGVRISSDFALGGERGRGRSRPTERWRRGKPAAGAAVTMVSWSGDGSPPRRR